MPQRIRLGTVTNGSLDSTDATIEIDGDDLYITVENGDVRTDGTVAFEDATADPTANGEIQRNGADLKAYSGGAVRNLSDIGGASAVIDDTDSPYTTSDEDVIYVDESGGAVTVELASADATLGNEIEVVNLTGTNTVTVSTEGSETIDPDADASKAITKAGWAVGFVSDGTNWTAGVTGEFESVTAGGVDITAPSDGTVKRSVEQAGAGSQSGNLSFQTTTGVSTTATAIFDLGVGARGGFLAIVSGDDDGNTDAFTDIVHFSRVSAPTTLDSEDQVGTPGTRDYTRNGTDVELEMSEGTYDVAVNTIGAFNS